MVNENLKERPQRLYKDAKKNRIYRLTYLNRRSYVNKHFKDLKKVQNKLINDLSTYKRMDKIKPLPFNESSDDRELLKATKLPPLWNDEIEDYLKKYPNFAGVICSDEIDKLPIIKPICFIMNTAKSTDAEGKHWITCYIDNQNVNYYDSLGDVPTNDFLKDIKKYVEKLGINNLLKLKVNLKKNQHALSFRCGYHAINAAENFLNGMPFKDVSLYKEADIKKAFCYYV